VTTVNGVLPRGEQVRHISPDIVGASRGKVLATFLDAEGEPVAAVQWAGGSITCPRLKWLDRAGPVPQHGQVHYLNDARRSA
jgi:hypothetical protein